MNTSGFYTFHSISPNITVTALSVFFVQPKNEYNSNDFGFKHRTSGTVGDNVWDNPNPQEFRLFGNIIWTSMLSLLSHSKRIKSRILSHIVKNLHCPTW